MKKYQVYICIETKGIKERIFKSEYIFKIKANSIYKANTLADDCIDEFKDDFTKECEAFGHVIMIREL